ncbi:tumor necrosis factor ligand superfamily member 13B-like [Rhinoraja longicauda]
MPSKLWNNLPESRTRSIMRGFVITVVILFLAVLCCLSLLVILLQQISDLQRELANVHKQLRVFNKRTRVNVGDMEHEKDMEDRLENLKGYGNAQFQIREELTIRNDKSYEFTSLTRKRRDTRRAEKQPSFLQLIPNTEHSTIQQDGSTFIPWIVDAERGEALAVNSNKIIVRKEGFYTVYSQVLYQDNCMAMGHVVRRRKFNVSGNEQRIITLFRCIQNMPNNTASNTCFTAGIVKLDQGDQLELLLPARPNAQISMGRDSTFFGAIQLL